MSPNTYQSYKNLPMIAGITSMSKAMTIGFSIDQCVSRLKRIHWAFRRLHEIFVRRLTAEPIYELKMIFSLHAHYCAEHAAALRTRVAEMREPPLGLDQAPDAALDVLFDEILASPTTDLLVRGLYEIALPALRVALKEHAVETNRLVDHPSFRVCRFALIEVDEMLETGNGCVDALVPEQTREIQHTWYDLLDTLLKMAGGLTGQSPASPGSPPKMFSQSAVPFDPVPRRDERFKDPYNMGVHAEAFLYDAAMPAEPKTLMMYYKRLREIDVPEMMASIIAETKGKPWDYTVDMTRQLWDEARHAMMGEVGFVRAGIDWQNFVRVNFTWSLALNTQLRPIERHAVLYFIEQGLMPKTGKRFEWEVGVKSGDDFSAMIQDYDWADEVLHARIGRDWFVRELGDSRKAIAYGDECWSRVLIDWKSYVASGLTRHENWWPGLYAEWCRVQKQIPDPRVAAFATSYETVRADLAELSTSG